MATKPKLSFYPLYEDDPADDPAAYDDNVTLQEKEESSSRKYKLDIVWRNVLAITFLHLACFYGIYLLPRYQLKTIIFGYIITLYSSLCIQAGAHRLWCHRAYKANFGLRLFLAVGFWMSLQNDIIEWVRDHRTHHRWSETDADPHNSKRGFFFSHVGWLMVRKHPDVTRMGKTVNLDDLKADPIVVFQKKYYIPLVALFWAFLPTFIPWYFWGEPLLYSAAFCVFFRYVVSLNVTWLVNSWSHLYGDRPYDTKIAPVEASIRHLLMGEGFHNYHHAFPWDYSASELGPLDVFNPTTAMINFFAARGWAWDLKKVKPEVIGKKALASGSPALAEAQKGNSAWEMTMGGATMITPLFIVAFTRYFF